MGADWKGCLFPFVAALGSLGALDSAKAARAKAEPQRDFGVFGKEFLTEGNEANEVF